ncbi:MFS transporter [Mumia zhuanghuii]|uniref:MFS transporter n=1 Tax=Mumia zhuanghuii TaxID=2585211 RepID=UPI00362B27FB
MTVAPVFDPPAQQMTPRSWGLLLVLCGALFLEGIDIAMLNVAVPAIAADLGLATGTAHWIISAYVLGYAGFMLLGGRSADLFGRRRVFLVGLTVFVAFSGVGGFADSGWLLVTARFATGVAAGFMTPAGFSIVTSSFPEGPLRNRALSVYGAVGAGGFTLGMVAGGLLTTASWRWVFFAPVVLGALLLVVGRALIRPDQPRLPSTSGFDVVGSVTVTAAMVSIVFALVSLGEGHTTTAALTLAGAAALLVGFVLWERRSPAPLLRLSILRHGMLLSSSTAGLLFMGAFFGFQLLVTLYLQELRGWTPLETGLTFAIMGADMVIAPLLTPLLVARLGTAAVMTAGFASATAAFALTLRLEADWTYVDLLPTLLLVAFAFAFAYGPLAAAATEGLDESEHGVAGGIVNTAFQFGAALGLSAVTIVLVGASPEDATLDDYRRALFVPTAAAALAVAIGATAWARRRGGARQRN